MSNPKSKSLERRFAAMSDMTRFEGLVDEYRDAVRVYERTPDKYNLNAMGNSEAALLAAIAELQQQLAAAQADAARLQGLIDSHNSDCSLMCATNENNGRCGAYTSRDRNCSDCPRDWMIIDSARSGGGAP